MANSAIKGITIKLGADASELTTALYEADNALKNTQQELRSITNALKFNPGNLELLGQKFTVLEDEIQKNDEYIEKLKKALAELPSKGIEEGTAEYRALQRELIQAESKQETFKKQLESTADAMKRAEKGTEEYDNALDSLDTKKATNELSTLKVACGNLVADGIEKLASAISGSLDAAISRVDSLNNYTKTMESLGFSAKEASKAQESLLDSIQNLPTSLDAIAGVQQQYTALFGDIEKGTAVTIALNDATLASGKGQEEASRAMDAWYKVIAKGKPEQEQWQTLNEIMPAQMNQIAESLLGAGSKSQDLFKAWQDGKVSTDEVTKAIENLDKNGGKGIKSFKDQAEIATGGIGTSIENLKTAITKGLANAIQAFGTENIAGIIDGLKGALEKLAAAFAKAAKFIGDHITIFGALATALGTIIGIYATWQAATKAQAAVQVLLNTVLAANPIGLVVTAIAALAAGLIYAYKHSKKFREIVSKVAEALSNLVGKVKNVATNVKNALASAFKSVTSIGSNIVTGIWKGISGKVSWLIGLIKGFANNVKDQLKSFFGIHSPSTWAKDMIGANIVKGMALGITDNSGIVTRAMSGLTAIPNIASGEMAMTGAAGGVIYNIGDITLDAHDVDGVSSVEDFVTVLKRAKRFK